MIGATNAKTVCALVLAGLIAAAPAPAHRAPTRARAVRLSGEIETLSSTGAIAVAGTRDTDAGILDGTVAGGPRWGGAVRQVVRWGTGLAITARGTLFAPDGALRYRLSGRFTPGAGGQITLTGTLVVTGGTGRYAGAQGRLRVRGQATISSGSPRSTLRLRGTLRLRH